MDAEQGVEMRLAMECFNAGGDGPRIHGFLVRVEDPRRCKSAGHGGDGNGDEPGSKGGHNGLAKRVDCRSHKHGFPMLSAAEWRECEPYGGWMDGRVVVGRGKSMGEMEKIGFPAANRRETSFGNRTRRAHSNHPIRKGKHLELQPIAQQLE